MKKRMILSIALAQVLFALVVLGAVSLSLNVKAGLAQTVDQTSQTQWDRAILALSAAITVIGTSVAAGMAISSSGTAAISASTEKPETFFRSFLVVALAEALAIYGLIIGILLWLKL